jgi:hypothetical protein
MDWRKREALRQLRDMLKSGDRVYRACPKSAYFQTHPPSILYAETLLCMASVRRY